MDGARGERVDFLFLGGGLAGGLAAYRLATARPGVSFALLEREPLMGGDHVWSFHEGDLTPAQRAWMAPLVSHRWPRYEVRFPRFRRVVPLAYCSVESGRFRDRVTAVLGDRLRTGTDVARAAAGSVTLADGTALEAAAVIDARGFRPSPALGIAYQKFVGQVLEFAGPIGLEHPIVMDATVEQVDGFRFVYVLPFGPRRALVEDTYYSAGAELDRSRIRREIVAYAERSGWEVSAVTREESGLLPVALSGDIGAFWDEGEALPRLGLRGALFHPTTGYSLPCAVATADLLADHATRPADAYRLLRGLSHRMWKQGAFFRGLNRMLLLAAGPAERYRVLERFYTLPDALVARFYAARLTPLDRARLLVGRPPVPVGAAVRALMHTSAGRPA